MIMGSRNTATAAVIRASDEYAIAVKDLSNNFLVRVVICVYFFLSFMPEPIHWLAAFIKRPATSRQKLIAKRTWYLAEPVLWSASPISPAIVAVSVRTGSKKL